MLLVKFDKKLVSSWGSSWLPSSWWQCWWFPVSLFLCSLPPPSSPLSFSRHCPCFDVASRGSFANFWKWTLMYCICCIFNWIFQVWGLNFKLKHEVFKKISQIKIYAYINIPDIHDMNKMCNGGKGTQKAFHFIFCCCRGSVASSDFPWNYFWERRMTSTFETGSSNCLNYTNLSWNYFWECSPQLFCCSVAPGHGEGKVSVSLQTLSHTNINNKKVAECNDVKLYQMWFFKCKTLAALRWCSWCSWAAWLLHWSLGCNHYLISSMKLSI